MLMVVGGVVLSEMAALSVKRIVAMESGDGAGSEQRSCPAGTPLRVDPAGAP